MSIELIREMQLARADFSGTRYDHVLSSADRLFESGDLEGCKNKLKELPTVKVLLEELVEKLKGKSVYRSIQKIVYGDKSDTLLEMKGISSLITHSVIECEKGNREYMLLIRELWDRLGISISKTSNNAK